MARKSVKEYYLMHKDIPVCLMNISEDGTLDSYRIEVLGFAPIFDSGNSMFYNIPYEKLDLVHLNEIKTHSFIEKEIKLLSYVKDRHAVNLDLSEMDFSIYEKDIYERHIRIPKLKEMYEQKCLKLKAFQNGKDIWKN